MRGRYRALAGAAALMVALAGCAGSSPSPQVAVYDSARALTLADQAALVYADLPRCTIAKPPCSDQATVDAIKKAAQRAHDAVKAAEAASDAGTANAATVAIAALVAAIPAH